jgi:hypothetical protein
MQNVLAESAATPKPWKTRDLLRRVVDGFAGSFNPSLFGFGGGFGGGGFGYLPATVTDTAND